MYPWKGAWGVSHDTIAVVDFGGQYAHLIATKVRRLDVLAEIRQPEDPIETFRGVRGIILSGSPALSAHDEDSAYTKELYDLPVPILGFCFGHQEIAKHYGGKVEHTRREYGPARLRIKGGSPVFAGLDPVETVWMSHGDSVTQLPAGFAEIGESRAGEGAAAHPNAAIADESRKRYGFQFHPEVDDTVHGDVMLRNFVVNICGCTPDWTMDRFLEEQVEAIRRQAEERGVLLLVSGGVDSTVCAVLIGRALGSRKLQLLHIDTGMMRKGESASVMEEFRRHGLDRNLHFLDASERFLRALGRLVGPEEKRKAIGTTFVEVFEEEARRLDLSEMLLGQGTIYPDTIETGGTKRADTIKTHHNRVPLIEELIAAGRVVEPIRELYKAEVRELGETLGIAEALLWRHPFPGPGLGVRLLCSAGGAAGEDLSMAQDRLDRILEETSLSGAVLPIRSVGVKGDLRSYEHPVALWGEVNHGEAMVLAGRIYQEVPGINRCVLDLSGRGLARSHPLAATVTRERLDLLREVDALVMEALDRHGLMRSIWQCPTVLVPLEVNGSGRELAILRPVFSERGMTALPAPLPEELVSEIRDAVMNLPGISGLVLDITTKPPGTIEWE